MLERAASRSTASVKLRLSIRCTNLMTSPPSAQEKQYQSPRAGVTLNDGVFSSWNGHSPLSEPPPALRSCRYSPMTSSIAERSRTSAMSSSRIRPATVAVALGVDRPLNEPIGGRALIGTHGVRGVEHEHRSEVVRKHPPGDLGKA